MVKEKFHCNECAGLGKLRGYNCATCNGEGKPLKKEIPEPVIEKKKKYF